ncbi:erythrocyte membrane protein 1, EMP1 [Plasmodium reichenowi]|uniref:Erythrocyte membrane protein 1, EMP1 n=1 Tax=Plasmodium reichenowi TaxID=5854 RepID=A0A060RQM7_PLARE|nr:erythrocyte membrane protein 1, EMP1 [Plasmodium reichenowi]
MAPKPEARTGGGHGMGEDGIVERSVKDLFDSIGGKVHEKVKDAAKHYVSELHGDLSLATYPSDEHSTGSTPQDPCDLQYDYHTNVTSGGNKEYPCRNGTEKRFSDTEGAQCHSRKIRDSKGESEGACAPFRRLHLCDKNLQNISDFNKINNKHNLLLEVLLAAKYEGESITLDHPRYHTESTGSTMCTELARSFADIGDIVRGKDLYRGGGRGRGKLDENLKTIFHKIKQSDKKLTSLTDDQVREYWWELNREKVWKAITCNAKGYKYFRPTCSRDHESQNMCRCPNADVPTNFDYVPQYLRWFHEWAEDFCRLRKKKLENAIKNCRYDESDDPKYCSRYGFDCTRTIRARGIYARGEDCNKCSVACKRFVDWIENQRKEFEKQKKKFENEIPGNGRKKRSSPTENYKGYEKYFNEELQNEGKDVISFLQLLSKERICKDEMEVKGKKISPVDFNEVTGKTFAPTEYCERCPLCGVDGAGGNWKPKGEDCTNEITENFNPKDTTDIPVISADKGKTFMLQKYKTFCSNTEDNKQIKNWECHYEQNKNNDGRGDINNCIQGEWKKFTGQEDVTTYHSFFYDSFTEMLKDSVDWRTQLKSCLDKAKENKCTSTCKSKCECFQKWLAQKKTEFKKIKEHFRKQGDIQEGTRDIILKLTLSSNFLNDMLEAKGDPKAIKRIEELTEKNKSKVNDITNMETIIDYMFEDDLQEATKCLDIHKEKCPPPPPPPINPAGRSLPTAQEEDSDEEEEEEEEEPPKKTEPPKQVENPCSGENGGDTKKYPVLAHKVAKEMHLETRKQLTSHGGRNLMADASKGTYRRGGDPGKLNDVCNITLQHSNDSRTNVQPCEGKATDRLKIGKEWEPKHSKDTSYGEFYMPPRRQHMCTSNLEKLSVGSSGLKGDKAIHSLLGDVLLSANYEAQDIKTKYQTNNGKQNLNKPEDRTTVCRAMKSSFADIGDIIRGRDLWVDDGGSRDMERHLKEIFKKIKEEIEKKHSGIDTSKYDKDDESTNPPYKQLREDWWEANRRQVWGAMTCETNQITCDGMPVEDYIPQRLRWMTEWAEWFCKYQSQEYDKLVTGCRKCKGENNGEKCYNDTQDCNTCNAACKEYEKNIKQWRKQWNKMSMHYAQLYSIARIAAANGGIGVYAGLVGDKDKPVVQFLQELQKVTGDTKSDNPNNTPNTPYESAFGYIHQEAHITECQKQKEFCENENGVKSSSGAKEVNEKYAFSLTPHEYKEACKCETNKKPEASPPQPPAGPPHQRPHEGRGRSDDHAESVVPQHPPAEAPKEDICNIVEGVLTGGDLNAACSQKYAGNNSRLGWKCISDSSTTVRAGRSARSTPESGSKSDNNGSICIPPRRRRLYVGKIKEWADKVGKTDKSQVNGDGDSGVSSGEAGTSGGAEGSSSTTEGTTPSNPRDGLRKAFVESAAVETFFLWDRYKKIKDQEDIEKNQAGSYALFKTSSEAGKKLQEKLNDGEIPEDFKRQMFYTLGDYRDICIGEKTMIQTVSRASNDDKTTMETIKNAIDEFLKKLNQENSGIPNQPTVNPSSNSDTPSSWWEQNTKYIWEGMLCALTYKTDSSKDKIEKIQPSDGDVDKLFQTLKNGNDYTTVTFKGGFDMMDDTTAFSSNEASDAHLTTNTKLDKFVQRPFFFRWLEEWADEFCRKQKHKLKIIESECKVNDGDKTCSGDGLRCDEKVPENVQIFKGFDCSTCASHCTSYRRWIERKKTEFEKQKNAYDGQKDKCEKEGESGAKQFCTKLKENCTEAKDFLDNLKGEPCKNNKEDEKENGGANINFGEDKTFQHATNCDPCSTFKIKCNGHDCRGSNGISCNGKKPIDAKDIETMEQPNEEVVMRVSDKSKTTFDDDLSVCKGAPIFKGIRKDEWVCGKVCGVDICTVKKTNTQGKALDRKYIIMKELIKRWLEYFFADYNTIQKKLKLCKNNGSKCIKECVDKWVEAKRTEWKNINEKYIKEYTKENDVSGNTLTSFLEGGSFRNEVDKAIKPCKQIRDFQSHKCNVTEISKKERGKDDTPKDIVDCLLDRLQNEMTPCPAPSSVEPSVANPENCDGNLTLVEDDDVDPLEEEENPVGKPSFCQTVDEKKETLDEGKCGEDTVPPNPVSEDTSGEDTKTNPEESSEPPSTEDSVGQNPDTEQDSKDPSEKAPAPAPAPDSEKDKAKPPGPTKDKKEEKQTKSMVPKPQIQSTTLPSLFPLTVGVGFLALSYWLLKVCSDFYMCVKYKKTKRPVDLFSIMEIPQNDYSIPTKLSSNRYIPYKSAQYRGKRYIYLEGDSGTDSGYTDHYSDITSSSESEYEELDINDIYVPGSPKYKTLIEVVLEPSKRDTQNDIPSGDIPSDTPNTPSDIPNTPSDIPPPITDDEWNQLKDDFISNMLQNTEPKNLHDNVDNNTNPKTLHVSMDEKPFIMSIYDRNLLSGEEYNYDMSNNIGNNNLYSGQYNLYSGNNDLYSGKNNLYSDVDSTSGNRGSYSDNHNSLSGNHHPYSGTDLINDTLSGDNHDIYDELLKRKENELFGTNHVKQTSTHSVAPPTNSDPIEFQLNLLHKWLDRHRDMCEQWDKNKKEELLDKLKEEWNNENNTNSSLTHTSNIPSNIPSSDIQTSDIPSGKLSDTPSGNKMLNTDVSIEIDMNNSNQVDDNIYLDTYPDKYTVDNINPVDSNTPNTPNHVQIELDVNNHKLVKEKYPISDMWDI